MTEIMPGLEESIDCLFCGTQTECTKFKVGEGGDSGATSTTNVAKWATYLCDLLKVNEEDLRKGVNDAYFCVECKRKVESFAKIKLLIDQMSEKVLEFRGKFEDSLYLSNFQNSEDSSSAVNQAQIRSKLMDAIEAERKKEREPRTAEVSVETEPVTIVNEDESQSSSQEKLNANNELITGKRKPHTVKIRMHDDSMVKSIIQALSQPANSSGYRTLVVKGSTSSPESPHKQTTVTTQQVALLPSYVLDLDHAGEFILENSADDSTVCMTTGTRKPPSYTCPVCSMKLENAEERRRHRNTHKENGLYKCPHCVVGYNKQELLVVHVQNMHPDKFPDTPKSKPRRGRKPSSNPRRPRKRHESESLTEESSHDSDLELDDEEEEVVESPDEEWDPEEEKKVTRGKRKPTKVKVTPKATDSSEINSSSKQTQPKRSRKTPIAVRMEGAEEVSDKCLPTEDSAPADETAPVKRRGRRPGQGRATKNKVVKVSSSKLVTTTTPNGTTEVYQASRQSDRIQLRHKFRQYFY